MVNNSFLNSASNFALGISNHAADPQKLIIRNNIADGGGGDGGCFINTAALGDLKRFGLPTLSKSLLGSPLLTVLK